MELIPRALASLRDASHREIAQIRVSVFVFRAFVYFPHYFVILPKGHSTRCGLAEGNTLVGSIPSLSLHLGMPASRYIFSDKTGTLTQNVMELKRVSDGVYLGPLRGLHADNVSQKSWGSRARGP